MSNNKVNLPSDINAGVRSARLKLALAVIPFVLSILILLWFIGTKVIVGDQVVDETGQTLQREEQPVDQLTVEEFLSLSNSTLDVSPEGRLIVNGELKANGAFILDAVDDPQDAKPGQVFYSKQTKEIKYFDGEQFLTLDNRALEESVCFKGADDCGFLTEAQVTQLLAQQQQASIPLAVNVSDLTNNGVLLGQGTGSIIATSAPGGGQVLIGNASGVPTFTSLSGDVSLGATGSVQLGSSVVGAAELSSTGVTAGTYGSVSDVPVFTVDADGRITSVANVALGAGGDIFNNGQLGPVTVGTNNATVLNLETNNITRLSFDSTGVLTLSSLDCSGNNNGGALTANGSGVISCSDDDGGGIASLSLDGDAGTPETLNDGNTITIAGGTNISTSVGATDTVTINFSGTLAVGSGGTGSTTAAGARGNLGAAASGANSDITSITGLTTDLSVSQGGTGAGTFTSNGVLYGNGTGAIQATAAGVTGQCLTGNTGSAPTWGSCLGSSGAPNSAAFITVGNDGTLTSERAITAGTNLSAVDGGANSTYTLNVVDNPTFTGLLTANGNLTIQAGDTFTFNGEAFTDLTGTGLTFSGGSLQTTLGTDIVTGEIVNDTILAADFDNTTAPGASEDNYVLTYDDATGGFTWVAPGSVGGFSSFDITDGGTTETINDGNTITFTDGTDIDLVVSATDVLTASNTSTLATVAGRGASTSTLLNLDGGIAVDTSNFTVSGTTGAIVTASTLEVQGASATIGADGTQGTVIFYDGGAGAAAHTGTLLFAGTLGQNSTITIPDPGGATDTFCLATLANCVGTDTFASIEVDGAAQSTGAATLDFDGTDFTLTEAPADDFDITINDERIEDIIGTAFAGGTQTDITITYQDGTDVFDFVVDTLPNLTGILDVDSGGTGATTFTDGGILFGNGTSAIGATGVLNNGELLIGDGTQEPTTATLTGGSGVDVTNGAGSITLDLGALTSNWDQTGAFDINLNNSSAELQILESGASPTFFGILDTGDLTGSNVTLTIANGTTGDICTSSGNCLGGGGGGANTALSNLSSVAINTSLLTGAATIDLGSDANAFRDLYLTGTMILEGATADGNETTISVVDPTVDVTYRFADPSGAGTYDICTTDGNCVGGAGGGAPNSAAFLTVGNNATLTAERAITAGTNINVVDGGANSTFTINVDNNPTFSGLVTANGNVTIQAGDTFTFNNDAFTDLTGTGLQINSGSLETVIGSTVDTTEIDADTILEVDLDVTNAGGAGVDNFVLSYDNASGGFTWIDPTGIGAFSSFDITDSTTTETINDGNTITFADGTDINQVVSATDTVTVNNTSTLASVTGRGATTTTLLNLDGGIAVDTSNFTVSGTNGNIVTAGTLAVQGSSATIGADGTQGTIILYDGGAGAGAHTATLRANGSLGNNTTVEIPSAVGASDTFCLVTLANCAAAAANTYTTINAPNGTDPVTTSSGETLNFADGTNITITGTAGTDTIEIAVNDAPTFSGLATFNGNIVLQSSDTITINGDAFDDLTGTGLQISGGSLQTTLGTDIVTGEIVDDTILAADLDNTAAPGASEDNYVLTYDNATGGFTWVDPTGIGTDTFAVVEVDGSGVSTGAPTLDFDGTDFTLAEAPVDSFDITINDERIEDIIGTAFGGGTQTDITVTYQDGTDVFDFVVDTLPNLTGTLDVDSGGTGATTFTAGGILLGNGTSAISDTGVLANGQLLIGDGAGAPTVAGLTGGNGLTVTNGAGSITLDLGALTSNWDQTGAFDISLNNSSSELQILESGTSPTFFGILDTGDLTGSNVTLTIENGSTGNICTDAGNCIGSGGGSAPNDAQYLTLALDGDLSGERTLNPGTSLTVTDNGADNNYDINTIQDIRTTANPQFASPVFTGTLDVQGASVTIGQASTTDGTLIFENDTNALTTTINAVDATVARTITLPNASGTFAVSASGNVALSATGDITLTGQVPIANGGTGASTAQAAINAISGLTTNGDLLYHNGTNSTRLPRGTANQCLLSTAATIQWGSCTAGGGGFTNLTLTADSGTPETINDTDTIDIAGGTNINTVVGATDTVTVNLDNAPTISGLLTLNGGLTLEAGDTFTFNSDAFDDLTGTGLTISGGDLQTTLGTDIVTGEIVDDTILAADLDNTAAPGASEDNYVATYDNATGGFTWVDPSTIGTDTFATVEVDGTAVSTDAPVLDFDGTDFTLAEAPTDSFDITINDERIEDIIGTAFAGGTQTDITVTYQDGTDVFDFVIDTLPNLTGVLDVDSGGTGATSFTAGGVLLGNGTSAVSDSGVLANGQLLIGDGSGAPTNATLTGGSGVDVTNGAGSITLDLGALTSNWDQTGAFDISLNNSSAELQILESGASPTFFGILDTGDLTGSNVTLTIENGSTGNICTDAGNCLGGAGGGANTALSNLSSVAINTSLLTGAATIDLGSDANAFRDLYLTGTMILEGATANGFETTISVVDPTADITYRFADAAAGTYDICTTDGNCVGGAGGGAPNSAAFLTVGNNAHVNC